MESDDVGDIEFSEPKKPKATSKPYILAYWFVTEYLGRPWTDTDAKGMHLKHAKLILADHDLEFVKLALLAWKDGVLGKESDRIKVTALTTLRSMEPPIIERFKEYCKNPPPKWKPTLYRKWCERTGNAYEVPTESGGERREVVPVLPLPTWFIERGGSRPSYMSSASGD